jgi:signal transducing adaptor molecule
MRDKGGRSTYAPAPAPSAGSSGASKYASGYVRAQSPPSPKKQAQAHTPTSHNGHGGGYPATSGGVSTKAASSTTSLPSQVPVVTRVRALHAFEPTEPGELAFEKGDVIKVVDRGYKDWWRGQLKGRTGIFPVNYVVRHSSHLPNHNNGSQVA